MRGGVAGGGGGAGRRRGSRRVVVGERGRGGVVCGAGRAGRGRGHVGELLAWNNIDIKCPTIVILVALGGCESEITNFVARQHPTVNIMRV